MPLPLLIPPLLSVLQAQQGCTTPAILGGARQAAGTYSHWNCVLMAAHFPYIKDTAVSFPTFFFPLFSPLPFPFSHLSIPRHTTEDSLWVMTMVCFCPALGEVNTCSSTRERQTQNFLCAGSAQDQPPVELSLHWSGTDRLWVGPQASNSLPSLIPWSPNPLALLF